MHTDWMTWSVWAIGLGLLVNWCLQTYREFRTLFTKRKTDRRKNN